MDLRVAVLVDGSFFLKRLQYFKREYYKSQAALTPEQTVKVLTECVRRHLRSSNQDVYQHLYRIFYYDSPPIDIKAHYPLICDGESNPRSIDFSKEESTIYRQKILTELKKQRKLALRLGTIKHDKQWKLSDKALNQLLKG